MSTRRDSVRLDALWGGRHSERKPPHPDLPHWTIATIGLLVMILALAGAPIVRILARLHPAIDQQVQANARLLHALDAAIWYTALGWWMVTGLGLMWAFVGSIFWRRHRVPALTGSYWTIVLPRPQGGRVGPTNTNPESPHVFWDRLLQLVRPAGYGTPPAYLALELWGNPGGRVQWGVWMPDHLTPQREAIRRLITADRPQARLVAAPDPLVAALQHGEDDASDDGVRWYGSALLTLSTRDAYPLLADGLFLASTVAALRPPSAVHASGVSLIVMPAPATWVRRTEGLVQRWRWIGRYARRSDERFKADIDDVSLKTQQAHARVCLRVQVVARSRMAANRECRSIVQTLTSSQKRYADGRVQGWKVRARRCTRVRHGRLPPALKARAPLRPWPRVLPLFPLT